jgi:hypothetical protein
MTPYTEQARVRADAAVSSGAAMTAPRLSINRRPLFDLPLGATGGSASAPVSQAIQLDEALPSDLKKPDVEPDFELPSTFDVPAFLRRQEG